MVIHELLHGQQVGVVHARELFVSAMDPCAEGHEPIDFLGNVACDFATFAQLFPAVDGV